MNKIWITRRSILHSNINLCFTQTAVNWRFEFDYDLCHANDKWTAFKWHSFCNAALPLCKTKPNQTKTCQHYYYCSRKISTMDFKRKKKSANVCLVGSNLINWQLGCCSCQMLWKRFEFGFATYIFVVVVVVASLEYRVITSGVTGSHSSGSAINSHFAAYLWLTLVANICGQQKSF